MANKHHVSTLKQGVLAWNDWRKKHPDLQPDLREANLVGAQLRGANLSRAHLAGADLASTDLQEANLQGAIAVETNFHHALLHKADLSFADLTFACLNEAHLAAARLWKADLTAATLSGANLTGANLTMALLRETNCTAAILCEAVLDYGLLVETNLRQANMTGCSVCGLSAWNLHLEGTQQANLILTGPNEPTIIVDTLEVAQFLSLFLNHPQLHQVITGITSRFVLILGRFTPERKPILETLRDELRVRGYTPLLLNFDMPFTRDCSVALHTLARLAHFIIADLSLHKGISQAVRALLSDTVVPVQPLLNGTRKLYQMFPDFKQYPCVLPGRRYHGVQDLQASLEETIINPAEAKAKELQASSTSRSPAKREGS